MSGRWLCPYGGYVWTVVISLCWLCTVGVRLPMRPRGVRLPTRPGGVPSPDVSGRCSSPAASGRSSSPDASGRSSSPDASGRCSSPDASWRCSSPDASGGPRLQMRPGGVCLWTFLVVVCLCTHPGGVSLETAWLQTCPDRSLSLDVSEWEFIFGNVQMEFVSGHVRMEVRLRTCPNSVCDRPLGSGCIWWVLSPGVTEQCFCITGRKWI